jgi:integrase
MAQGSIRRFDGGWGYRVDLGPDPSTGKRRQASKQGFRTKRQAELAMQETIGAARDGVVPNRSGRALGDFLDEWLEMQKDRLRPSTLYSYQVVVERIKIGLGHAKIQSLTPLQIEQFYASLIADGGTRGQGLSPKTVRNTHVVSRKALSDAERLEVVVRNAAAAANVPRAPDRNIEPQLQTVQFPPRALIYQGLSDLAEPFEIRPKPDS